MYGENNMEANITICKIDNQGAAGLRKLKQGPCINIEGWGGKGGGGRVRREGTYVYLWLLHEV